MKAITNLDERKEKVESKEKEDRLVHVRYYCGISGHIRLRCLKLKIDLNQRGPIGYEQPLLKHIRRKKEEIGKITKVWIKKI